MNKLALVTGCSRGIGWAITEMLLAEGWFVLGLSRTSPPPRDGLFWFEWDAATDTLSDILGCEAWGVLDAVIHCAGTQEPVGAVANSDADAWAQSIVTNLIGTYRVIRAALPSLQLSADGRILLFSGGGAFSPRPFFSAYAAAKAGVVALMECLAGELPPQVTVNCVAPGFVPTDIHAPTLAAGADLVGTKEYRHATQTPNGEMERVVACVRHLLSGNAKGLTGKTISAPYDDWPTLATWNVEALNASPAGTRSRHLIQRLSRVTRHPTAVLV